jgi:hypothetical protein
VAIPEIPVGETHEHPSDSTSGSTDQDHHKIEIEHIEGEHQ